jgi:hypothetical protein
MRTWNAILAALSAALFAAQPLYAQEAAPAAASEEAGAMIDAETIRADLNALYAAMQAASVDLYAYRSKVDFDAFHAGLREQVTAPMSRLDAALLFQRLAAFARIGHIRSNAWVGEAIAEFGQGAQFAPLLIRVEPDGRVFLTDPAMPGGSAPAGAQLTSIDGEPIARILARTRDFVSAERAYMADTLLEDFFPILYWAQNPGKDIVSLGLETESETGRTFWVAQVPTLDFGSFRAMLAQHAAPSPATDFNAREFRMVDDRIAYLRPGPFAAIEGEEPVEGRPEAAMVRFIDGSFAAMIAAGATDLIIDLRNNPGGDITFSDPMVAWFADRPFSFASEFTLRASAPVKAHYDRVAGPDAEISPFLARLAAEERAQPDGALYPFEIATVDPRPGQRFEGRVWVLVNRRSFSNATSTAALIKDYGFGTIMGEETADVPTSFASIFPFVLPGTGMSVDLAKSYFVRPGGEETVRGVIPDIALPRQQIGSATDTMLEAALTAVRQAPVKAQ